MSIICLFVLYFIIIVSGTSIAKEDIGYSIVVDAGSTGSRAFIFKIFKDDNNIRSITSIPGRKVTPGLASFSNSSGDEIVAYLLPTFLDAAEIIPKYSHKSTKVYIKGTAGFRLLSDEEQSHVWDHLQEGLDNDRNVPFIIKKENLGTIDGSHEAYYAALASNYVAGSINGDLKRVEGKAMVGALDMGGSSTQLIFHTETIPGMPINHTDFWSHSWLNFGVERIRMKVWDSLIENYIKKNPEVVLERVSRNILESLQIDSDGNFIENNDDTDYIENIKNNEPLEKVDERDTVVEKTLVENPCTFIGYEEEYNEKYRFIGVGDGLKCVEIIKQVVWPDGLCAHPPCAVDTITHPPLNGEFYGMSVYYYGLDCIRFLGPNELSWPTPTINEIYRATLEFCSLEWKDVQENMVSKDKKHKFTKFSQLQYRCTEGLYMSTLLKYGFGFDVTQRNITFALEVLGHEVEWTLGFALADNTITLPLHLSLSLDNESNDPKNNYDEDNDNDDSSDKHSDSRDNIRIDTNDSVDADADGNITNHEDDDNIDNRNNYHIKNDSNNTDEQQDEEVQDRDSSNGSDLNIDLNDIINDNDHSNNDTNNNDSNNSENENMNSIDISDNTPIGVQRIDNSLNEQIGGDANMDKNEDKHNQERETDTSNDITNDLSEGNNDIDRNNNFIDSTVNENNDESTSSDINNSDSSIENKNVAVNSSNDNNDNNNSENIDHINNDILEENSVSDGGIGDSDLKLNIDIDMNDNKDSKHDDISSSNNFYNNTENISETLKDENISKNNDDLGNIENNNDDTDSHTKTEEKNKNDYEDNDSDSSDSNDDNRSDRNNSNDDAQNYDNNLHSIIENINDYSAYEKKNYKLKSKEFKNLNFPLHSKYISRIVNSVYLVIIQQFRVFKTMIKKIIANYR